MKRTFTIKLDTTITIDFATYGLSDAEQKGGYETRKLLVNKLLDHSGVEEFEVKEQHSESLFEAMADVVRKQNERVES